MHFPPNEMSLLSPKAIFALISCLQANQLWKKKTCIVNVQKKKKQHYQIKTDDCEFLNKHWTQQ